MESLQVRTGQIQLKILDDFGNTRGIFNFNPQDVESAKQVLQLQTELADKQVEYDKRIEEATTAEDKINLLDDVVNYFNGSIDRCFGEGSSDVLFGGARTLSMYEDFFLGITPYYSKASTNRTAKYRKNRGN